MWRKAKKVPPPLPRNTSLMIIRCVDDSIHGPPATTRPPHTVQRQCFLHHAHQRAARHACCSRAFGGPSIAACDDSYLFDVLFNSIENCFSGKDPLFTAGHSSFPIMSYWVDLCNRAIERSLEQSLIAQTQTLGAIMVSLLCLGAIVARLIISSLPPC